MGYYAFLLGPSIAGKNLATHWDRNSDNTRKIPSLATTEDNTTTNINQKK